jgi:formate hydrogenlyase subunit 4
MFLGLSTELLVLIAAGALGTSLLEGAFERNALSRFVAHIVAAVLLLIVFVVRYSRQPVSMPGLIATLASKPALFFIGISAGIASILEAFLRKHALFRFVALLVGVWLVD